MVPILLKNIFQVLDLVTEFLYPVLWKLCKNYRREDEGILVETFQMGAFQKVSFL